MNADLKKLPAPLPKLTGQRPGVPSMPSRQAPSDPFLTTDESPGGSGATGPVRLPPRKSQQLEKGVWLVLLSLMLVKEEESRVELPSDKNTRE